MPRNHGVGGVGRGASRAYDEARGCHCTLFSGYSSGRSTTRMCVFRVWKLLSATPVSSHFSSANLFLVSFAAAASTRTHFNKHCMRDGIFFELI